MREISKETKIHVHLKIRTTSKQELYLINILLWSNLKHLNIFSDTFTEKITEKQMIEGAVQTLLAIYSSNHDKKSKENMNDL